MGGNRFFTRATGDSMEDAYKKACKQADSEYGHQQGYSGEINSTGGFLCKTEKYRRGKFNSVDDLISTMDRDNELAKGNAYGVCLREPKNNTNKIKSQVENNPFAGTRIWKLMYVPYASGSSLGSFPLKADAIKKARAHTEATKIPCKVMIERHSVQDAVVSKITYKGDSSEAPGDYIFFGIASC